MSNKETKILITGGKGMIGTFLKQLLQEEGFTNVYAMGRDDADLLDWQATRHFFESFQPDYVFHLAAAVFGIMGNMQQKSLSFFQNTLINTHVVEASCLARVKKIVAMGSGAAYPYPAPRLPLNENDIWQGAPHGSEDSYGHSKRAMLAHLIAARESTNIDYAFVLSCNLYGPYDKFDIHFGHVVPSLVRKFHEAKQNNTKVTVWGDGSAERDFLYAEDAAQALIYIWKHITGSVNIGSGIVHKIRDIVDILADCSDMKNQIAWDTTKPNGQGYRAYDLTKLHSTGFWPKFSLEQGLERTWQWYQTHENIVRK